MEDAQQFGQFLKDVCTSSNRTTSYQTKFLSDEYLATILPAQTHFPLAEFTGPQDNLTILLSAYVPQVNDSTLSSEYLDTSQDSSQSQKSTENSASSQFPLECTQVVFAGQRPLQSRTHLPSSHSRHTSQASNQIDSLYHVDLSDFTPLSLDDARYLASLYSVNTRRLDTLPNIWILCSDNKRGIISLGCSMANSALYTYTITSDDSQHSEGSRKGVGPAKQSTFLSSSIFSQYVITGADSQDRGRLLVEFSWMGAEKSLSQPPKSADAVIKVSASPGYMFSPVLATYTELSTLLSFCGFSAGKSKWPEQEQPTGVDMTHGLSQKIESFLSDVASPLSQPLDATVISPTSDNSIYEARKDLDFAERLWMFAKDAASLDELQEIFASVFKAVLLGRVQPFVHRNSSSTLASLLRQLLQCTSTEERQALAPRYQTLLSPTKLLPCLVQIGLEKMHRDYRTFFVSSDIATHDQLDEFSSTKAGSQLGQCHTLCKLHCVLEINASLLSFLNLPSSTLSSLTKTALRVYQDLPFDSFSTTPTFTLPVIPYSSALKSLISVCSKLKPTVWSGLLSKDSVVMYRNEPLNGPSADSVTYHVYRAKCDSSCMLEA